MAATRRARTEAARDDRREAILAAAAEALARDGFEGVTMARLAGAAGLAKGTLYLYFATREEVFLALFVQRLDAFAQAVVADPGEGPGAVAEALVGAAGRDPLFLALLARLGSVIEQNLSRPALYAAKLAVWRAFEEVSAHLARRLGLSPEAGRALGAAAMVALQGAAQAEAPRPPEDPAMPAEVRAVYDLSAFRPLALNALTLAVRGALAGPG